VQEVGQVVQQAGHFCFLQVGLAETIVAQQRQQRAHLPRGLKWVCPAGPALNAQLFQGSSQLCPLWLRWSP
jgi:hypothetical protein